MNKNYTITTEQTLNKTSIEKLITPGTKANKKVKRKSNQQENNTQRKRIIAERTRLN